MSSVVPKKGPPVCTSTGGHLAWSRLEVGPSLATSSACGCSQTTVVTDMIAELIHLRPKSVSVMEINRNSRERDFC